MAQVDGHGLFIVLVRPCQVKNQKQPDHTNVSQDWSLIDTPPPPPPPTQHLLLPLRIVLRNAVMLAPLFAVVVVILITSMATIK